MAGPRKKQKKQHHETLAEAVRREQEEDVVRDLRASLAHDPTKTTRAKRLAELRALPRMPTHPLALYLKERGVSRAQAAEMLGLRPAEIDRVVRDWERPRDAEIIAQGLGMEIDDLFPGKPVPVTASGRRAGSS